MIVIHKISWLFLATGLMAGCKQKDTLFEKLSSGHTGIHFNNTIVQSDSSNILQYVYFYNGGGVAVCDINNDGLKDLYFTGNQVSSRLYLNLGDFRFRDITESAGVTTDRWTSGVATVDINGDGWLDLYVCATGSQDSAQRTNLLFINNGNLTFTESAAAYGLADTGYATHAAFLDYDKDGDLDMYLLSHHHEVAELNAPRRIDREGKGASNDKLYRNEGNGTFRDVTIASGVTTEGFGLGVAVTDVNRDGWPDLYISNDFIFNDLLYINQQDGTFQNKIEEYITYQSFNGMGNDVADINNDGLVDILVADMLPKDNQRLKQMLNPYNYDKAKLTLQMGYQSQYMRNTLQLNNGDGPNENPSFSEIAQVSGIHNTDWSWGPLLADFDNDGHKDVFIANGYLKDMTDLDFIVYRKRNMMFKSQEQAYQAFLDAIDKLWEAKLTDYVFRNNHNLTFTDISERWGITEPSFSNGAAYADLDNDGYLDLVINTINDEAFVYRNRGGEISAHRFLQVELKGPANNPSGFGSKVRIITGNNAQVLEQSPYRGFMSTVDHVLHFGVGQAAKVDSLEVFWPDGRVQIVKDVSANQRVILRYEDASDGPAQSRKEYRTTLVSNSLIAYAHEEEDFEDFKIQHLIPRKVSTHGPVMAVADVNDDGLEDVFIGGSKNQKGILFLQHQDGEFTSFQFSADSMYEDTGAAFFDADNDGDPDLYVVSGSAEFPDGSEWLQDRLYLNDGKGNFTKSEALPAMKTNGAVVALADFDQDGDIDLFVGGGSVPGQYPLPSRSYILENEGGKFTDVTSTVGEELANLGVLTNAVWNDIDADGWEDLVMVGDWMPVTIYKNENGKLTNYTAQGGLSDTQGWWNSLEAGDMDGDGDTDFIAGNLGLNTVYKASKDQPITLYAKDYDQNSSMDPIMFRYIDGRLSPVPTRDDLISQLSGIRHRFTTYKKYTEASTPQDLFTDEELEGAYVLKAVWMESGYIENLGDGTFRIQALPLEAQLAPVHGILMEDINQDGEADVLLGGNLYASDIVSKRTDYHYGVLLLGNGKGDFSPVSLRRSGFRVSGPVSAIKKINRQEKAYFLVGINGDSMQTFTGREYHLIPPL